MAHNTMWRNTQKQRRVTTTLRLQRPWTSRRTPKIHDCYGILKRVAWLWRLVAIFPYTITEETGKEKYGINRLYAIYSIFIFIVCFNNLIFGILRFNEFLRSEEIARAYVAVVARTLASMMSMFISSVIRVYRRNELPELIEAIAAQETFLERMGYRFNHEGNAKIIKQYTWACVIVPVLFIAYDYSATIGVVDNSSTIHWLVWILPLVAQILNLVIFVSLVGLLGSMFHALNEKIETVAIRVNASSPKIIVTSDVCAEKLQLVAKAHFNICAVSKRINAFFNWDIIINVITANIILTSTLHAIFLDVHRKNNTNWIRIGSWAHWEVLHSVPIIVIVMICNWTTRQSIQAGKLIHEIRVDNTDSRLYEAVKSFSLQLYHQKLEFTAGGFFSLTSKMLQAMVENIASSLVILIQFEPSYYSDR